MLVSFSLFLSGDLASDLLGTFLSWPNVYSRSTPHPRGLQPAQATINRSARVADLIGQDEPHLTPIDIGLREAYKHSSTQWHLAFCPCDHRRVLQLQ